tara:strand:- start:1807 stop:2160 length:354 start_codon:yes stop_codon:yes gene_type:complete
MKITLTQAVDNIALQVGDVAYFATLSSQGVYDINYNNNDEINETSMIGIITEVGGNFIVVANPVNTPSVSDFIFFAKDNVVNNSGVKGYYAEVELTNSSKDRIELFSVNSEIYESSK